MTTKTACRLACPIAFAGFALLAPGGAFAQSVNISLVTVGDPGNVADTTGFGSVGYTYLIGKYDVTTSQYTTFLNDVAATDPYGAYNVSMGTSYSTQGITRTGSPGRYKYSTFGDPNMPVFDVSWGDATRFVNWLQNGEPSGPEGPNTTETGTYALNGGTSNAALLAVTRSTSATWVLPTLNEWYKAAYYVGGGTNAGYWFYPTQSNNPPSEALSATGTNNANYTFFVGSSSPTTYLTPVGTFGGSPGAFGSFDMGGDVEQWNETEINDVVRGLRGGSWAGNEFTLSSWFEDDISPTDFGPVVGFRVANVSPTAAPEPGSCVLLAVFLLFVAFRTVRDVVRRKLHSSRSLRSPVFSI